MRLNSLAPGAEHLHNKDQKSVPPTSLWAPADWCPWFRDTLPNVLPYAALGSDSNLWLACEMSGFLFFFFCLREQQIMFSSERVPCVTENTIRKCRGIVSDLWCHPSKLESIFPAIS